MSKSESAIVTAVRIAQAIGLDAKKSAPEWESADPIHFSSDWQGQNADPGLDTEVRVLWSPEMLYLRFVCRYREVFMFEDSDPNGRRDRLWERDVAEAFLQPPDAIAKSKRTHEVSPTEARQSSRGRFRAFYKEFEIAPNGMWIDLDISPSGSADLRSGLSRSVYIDRTKNIWIAELAIPIHSLTTNFNPAKEWRANFFRVEGKLEPRRYNAWQPTMTAQPDFHVPEKFGRLQFGR